MRTLVLNVGYEPMHIVTWQRAICLVLTDRADLVSSYDEPIRSVSRVFPRPAVVRLKAYVRPHHWFSVIRCSRKNIILRDRSRCQYCGVACRPGKITIDHVTPKARGGRTVWENVVAACQTCNHRKGDRTPDQIGMRLIRRPARPQWFDLIDHSEGHGVHAWMPYINLASGF
jgi:5-methylcytosine-specific restriction endonuclease McrA